MWRFWCLAEGTLKLDPEYLRTNAGAMPPVIHVDTDAPLYDDADGSLVTDKLWGIYYKPDFNFGGVQGGAMPYVVQRPAAEVAVDPYGPASPDFVVGPEFARMWTSALAHCHCARLPSTAARPLSAPRSSSTPATTFRLSTPLTSATSIGHAASGLWS